MMLMYKKFYLIGTFEWPKFWLTPFCALNIRKMSKKRKKLHICNRVLTICCVLTPCTYSRRQLKRKFADVRVNNLS